jgi:unsaturated rhamnogalacturonyl hydrolase
MKHRLIFFLFILLTVFFIPILAAQERVNTISNNIKWSERMALSVMKRSSQAWQIDNNTKPKWDYKQSFVLSGYEKLYSKTGEKSYKEYIKNYADVFIDSSGAIPQHHILDYNIDYVNPGKLFFNLNTFTRDSRYLKAMQLLRKQLEEQPRNAVGGFWHKNVYPDQMWLDGLYMAAPFYTRYTVEFESGKGLDDVAHQFELIEANDIDLISALPFHAWDQSKNIAWADRERGTSPTIWSRGVGWYAMALVDVLEYFPKEHPKHKELVTYLNKLSNAIAKYQDPSGLWFQVIDKRDIENNYLETSGTAMFTYAFAKGVNKGYLPSRFKIIANKSLDGIVKNFVQVDLNGEVHLKGISPSIGLGGNPFRDGSYAFYTKGETSTDNSIGVGAFILASLELNR